MSAIGSADEVDQAAEKTERVPRIRRVQAIEVAPIANTEGSTDLEPVVEAPLLDGRRHPVRLLVGVQQPLLQHP